MEVSMEIQKKQQKIIRCTFTKAANELEVLLKDENQSNSSIEMLWECLKLKFDELHICHGAIYKELLENASEEELMALIDGQDMYVKRFTELKLKCSKVLEVRPVVVNTETKVCNVEPLEETQAGKRKFKLPRIEFKHYDGNIKDWLSFWSQFKKIHEDPEIDDSDKVEYLIQATVPGSRARQLVESYPARAESYVNIIDSMMVRFGREDIQVEVYVRELLKLVLNNALSQQKLDICKLYDQIETQLRALETLGITVEKYAAILFPLIESSLPQDLLRVWQRSHFWLSVNKNIGSSESLNADITLEVKLANLISFLRSEVESEQRISLASEGFGLTENINSFKLKSTDENQKKRLIKNQGNMIGTTVDLVNTNLVKCIFCMNMHDSDKCIKAQKMTMDERQKIVKDQRACFRCLRVGHQSRKCRIRLSCIICKKSHVPLMCTEGNIKKQPESESGGQQNEMVRESTLMNQTSTHVYLQTLLITLEGAHGSSVVRALIDTGSQRSYILNSTVRKLGLKAKRTEKITHCLFGGNETISIHYCYDVTVSSQNYKYTFEVLDQPLICNDVSSLLYGPWMHELKGLQIDVSDYGNSGPIEVLLGADVAEILYTGRRHMLQCGLVAIETYVGWTVMGKVKKQKFELCATMTVLSLFVKPSITNLWELDVLGIREPTEKKSKDEMALAAKEIFLQTISKNAEGRYEVRLPWLDGHSALPTNYHISKKRLNASLEKLKRDNLLERYEKIFKEWLSLNIIEQIEYDNSHGHFLPHRPVLKEGSTTAVRPVFDASACEKDKPSLNHCIEKGLNLIEQIPSILLRFREFKKGVISDIKKAFLQISISEKDRNYLKFLWVDKNGQEIVFRHRRVVFGVNCSPFLLGATIDYHLQKCLEISALTGIPYSVETIKKLASSFYVDNCVTSLPDSESLNRFIQESTTAMMEGKFELRGWEFSDNSKDEDYSVQVLGLRWYPKQDFLTINKDLFKKETQEAPVTKRRLLSLAQRVFDPIGFTAPTTLVPKLLLQRLWEKHISWDAPVDEEIAELFKKWFIELRYLENIRIPRWISTGGDDVQDIGLHTFCDASQSSYAAVIFCRVKRDYKVSVHLLAAKSRVAPLKTVTIPRLELIAATIGARLYTQVEENLGYKFQSFFWSDSSTVLSWIQRNEEWGTFVWNRVSEIRRLTSADRWLHVPGVSNPADLPSRGCTPKQLLKSRWWEGPSWLYQEECNWPVENPNTDEEEIYKERKKNLLLLLLV